MIINQSNQIKSSINQSKWLKGIMIFLHPGWFFGRCLEIISANQMMFLISWEYSKKYLFFELHVSIEKGNLIALIKSQCISSAFFIIHDVIHWFLRNWVILFFGWIRSLANKFSIPCNTSDSILQLFKGGSVQELSFRIRIKVTQSGT